jgi:hypothetical protein
MARVVRGKKLEGKVYPYVLQPMPQLDQLDQSTLDRYKTRVGARIEEFPGNIEHWYKINTDVSIENYLHRLSYDAESILWLLLYWAIQIQPDRVERKNPILGTLWANLTWDDPDNEDSDVDPRMSLVPLPPSAKLCHPGYEPLDSLLVSLFAELFGYQEYTEPEPKKEIKLSPREEHTTRMKVDYLHEALQRTILAFIVQHREDPFMELKISPKHRRKPDGGIVQPTNPTRTATKVTRTEQEKRDGGTATVDGETGAVDGETGTVDGETGPPAKRVKTEVGPEPEGMGERGRPNARSTASQYVARTFFHHVGADIPTGAHRLPNWRKGKGWRQGFVGTPARAPSRWEGGMFPAHFPITSVLIFQQEHKYVTGELMPTSNRIQYLTLLL